MSGPAVYRVINWWLAYRKVRPSIREIRDMIGAVKQCLGPVNPHTEHEVERQLHELMRSGRDVPYLLLVACGWVLRSRARRVGGRTWMHEPRPASCWSASERPELYREIHVSPPSSRNWLPAGRSTDRELTTSVVPSGDYPARGTTEVLSTFVGMFAM